MISFPWKSSGGRRRFAFCSALAPACAAILGAALPPANAADKPAPTPEFECRWAEGKITIDGKADEPAWKHAQVIDNFYVPWLGEKARPAKTATRARLLWDREYLYFFADMDDGDLYADEKEHDGQTWDNDVFELFFKPADDKPGYYEFQVNAAGTKLDMFLPRRGSGGFRRYKGDGEFHWEAKVILRGTLNKWQDKDEGWSAEGRIPWTDFLRTGGRPAIDEQWKFALCRYDYSVDFEGPELSTCAPLGSLRYPDFHHHEDYAILKFIGPKPENAARPWGIPRHVAVTTSRVVGSPEPPPPYRVTRALPKLRLSWPIFVVNEPGSRRLIFIDQVRSYGPARIARTTDDPESGEFETLLTFDDAAAYSITFHPQFAKNGHVYIGLNAPVKIPKEEPKDEGGKRKDELKKNGETTNDEANANSSFILHPSSFITEKRTRVVRYTMDRKPPYRLDPDSALLIIEWPSDGHNGGAVAFGLDGMLYITSGDGTSDSDTDIVGQDLTKLVSKVLRIDVDHPADGQAYSVPQDNPFAGRKDARPETWAHGFRNPWRMSVDPRTGHVWVGNNGQDLWEQIYLVERGANYGWSVYEGGHPFYLSRQLGSTPVSKPTFDHPHSEARSLTGGMVYYGKKFPDLQGAYLYGDYSTGKIWGAKHDGKKVLWHRELADSTLQITSFGLDADGELLISDHQGNEQGGFYTLEPLVDDGSSAAFPRTLSDSGLFRSVAGHEVRPGLVPYSVNAPLWSDGAYKERYIALPPTMGPPGKEEPSRIEFTAKGSWNFPDLTVLVKSFALEMEEGNPQSRRWIETRFLTRQEGEWVGYSYRWNDEQTEAALVDKAGLDREFTVRTPTGVRKQAWRYPSRSECMVCHSRAANFVLGLSTMQMNKDHAYGGVVDNQLRVLEHLGLLRTNWHTEATAVLRRELKESGLSEKEVNERVAQLTATRNQRSAPSSSLLAQSPERYERLADPYDATADLELRARSYLHSNCAQCHVGAGGGNAQMELEFTATREKMNVFDVPPLHDRFGIEDARLIAPGDPDRSVLLHRLATRGRGQMPQLATVLVDEEAVALFRAWIKGLEPNAAAK